MSKTVKGLIENELKSRFEDMREFIVVSMRGISGTANNELRGDLLAKQIEVSVVKNSLAGRAFEQLGMGSARELLTGPCAIARGGDSIVDVAKVLAEWCKKLEELEVKGGYLDGELLDAKAAFDLSKLPSRGELQATIVTLANSPARRVAGLVNAPASIVTGCIEAVVKKLEAA